MAIDNHQPEVVKLILKSNVDLSVKNRDKQQAIELAMKKRYFDIVDLLLPLIDINKKFHDSSTLLLQCANRHNIDYCKKLISLGANIHALDNDNLNVLDYTVLNNNENSELFFYFIEQGIKPSETTLFLSYLYTNNLEIIQYLETLFSINYEKLVMEMIKADTDLKIIQYVIEAKNASINYVNQNNENLLLYAIHFTSPNVFSYLLDLGICPYEKNTEGKCLFTQLLNYSTYRSNDIAKEAFLNVLAKKGKLINDPKLYLHFLHSNLDKKILANFTTQEIKDEALFIPHIKTEEFEQLCDLGANINIQNKEGLFCIEHYISDYHGYILDFILNDKNFDIKQLNKSTNHIIWHKCFSERLWFSLLEKGYCPAPITHDILLNHFISFKKLEYCHDKHIELFDNKLFNSWRIKELICDYSTDFESLEFLLNKGYYSKIKKYFKEWLKKLDRRIEQKNKDDDIKHKEKLIILFEKYSLEAKMNSKDDKKIKKI
jgi:ankyrin repeat protein